MGVPVWEVWEVGSVVPCGNDFGLEPCMRLAVNDEKGDGIEGYTHEPHAQRHRPSTRKGARPPALAARGANNYSRADLTVTVEALTALLLAVDSSKC